MCNLYRFLIRVYKVVCGLGFCISNNLILRDIKDIDSLIFFTAEELNLYSYRINLLNNFW